MTLCISTYDEAAEPIGVFISKCNWQGKNDQDGISHEFWLTKPPAKGWGAKTALELMLKYCQIYPNGKYKVQSYKVKSNYK